MFKILAILLIFQELCKIFCKKINKDFQEIIFYIQISTIKFFEIE